MVSFFYKHKLIDINHDMCHVRVILDSTDVPKQRNITKRHMHTAVLGVAHPPTALLHAATLYSIAFVSVTRCLVQAVRANLRRAALPGNGVRPTCA